MKLQATFAASPFEGDLLLPLYGLPVGAQVTRATAQITPAWDDVNVPLSGNPPDQWGITWDGDVLDFHARRTVRTVRVNATGSAHVQIDMGGIWAQLNDDASLSIPDDGKDEAFAISSGGIINLHSAATSRIRITDAITEDGLSYEAVTFGSVPTNAALFVGELGPVWIQVGEMRAGAVVPDFANVLHAYLIEAETQDGYYLIEFKLHSDGIARLALALALEYELDQSLLPPDIRDAHLTYRYDLTPVVEGAPLVVSLPPNARVIPGGTRLSAMGTFEGSRVNYGSTTPTQPEGVVVISSGISQAQPVIVDHDLTAAAIDLLVEPLTPTATLSIVLLDDAGGKPFGKSLLSRPAVLQSEQRPEGGLQWASVALPEEFTLAARQANGAPRRYWVVVNSNAGDVSWGVDPAPTRPALHTSRDAGLSWQDAQIVRLPSALNARLRLRYTPAQYRVPIQAQIGSEIVPLDRFSPLGKVDFTVDFPALAEAFNRTLAQVPGAACRDADHIANGNFQHWYGPQEFQLPEDWALMGGSVWRRRKHESDNFAAVLQSTTDTSGALSQVMPVSGGCGYTFEFYAEATRQGVVAELTWLGDCLTALRTDTIPIYHGDYDLSQPRLHRAYLESPAGATQAELRFIVPPRSVSMTYNSEALLDDISLSASSNTLRHSDLGVLTDAGLPEGWTLLPLEAAADVIFNPWGNDCTSVTAHRSDPTGATIIRNCYNAPVTLTQLLTVSAGQVHILETRLETRHVLSSGGEPARLELHWLDGAGVSTGNTVIQPADERSAGLVPRRITALAEQAELRLVIPAGVDLAVWQIALREQATVEVPVNFLAETPGELTVTAAHVAYELAEPTPPPVPADGLCTPTPPDQKPGTSTPDHCCYCPQCAALRPIENAADALTPNRRPAAVGTCAVCGAALTRLGGAAARISTAEARHALRATLVRSAALNTIRALALVDIKGIAAERTKELTALGIDSVAKLATASPAEVAQLKSVDLERAVDFIQQARTLILSKLG